MTVAEYVAQLNQLDQSLVIKTKCNCGCGDLVDIMTNVLPTQHILLIESTQ